MCEFSSYHCPGNIRELQNLIERAVILHTVEAIAWVIGGGNGAAAKRGLKPTTLICKMQKLGIWAACPSRWLGSEGTPQARCLPRCRNCSSTDRHRENGDSDHLDDPFRCRSGNSSPRNSRSGGKPLIHVSVITNELV